MVKFGAHVEALLEANENKFASSASSASSLVLLGSDGEHENENDDVRHRHRHRHRHHVGAGEDEDGEEVRHSDDELLFVVPYNQIKNIVGVERDDKPASPLFEREWLSSLEAASGDFQSHLQCLWTAVFEEICNSNNNNNSAGDEGQQQQQQQQSSTARTTNGTTATAHCCRGALPDEALRRYLEVAGTPRALDLLARLVTIQQVAHTNSEALRKLLKKYDKHNDPPLSPSLLPLLYSSNFHLALSMLEDGILLIRASLELREEEEEQQQQLEQFEGHHRQHDEDDRGGGEEGASSAAFRLERLRNRRQLKHGATVVGNERSQQLHQAQQQQRERQESSSEQQRDQQERHLRKNSSAEFDAEHYGYGDVDHRLYDARLNELEWLNRLTSSLPQEELSKLVAHRGFHHIADRNDKRPLENSRDAYETAWTSGIHLCECDIALTKDEKLVLAHDEDFSRLALNKANISLTKKRVGDLTFQQIMSLQLKSGSRPPLLLDILRSAQAISGQARLIIEIKPGNLAAASALSRLLVKKPNLVPCVAMIMSFDATIMHRLKRDLLLAEQQLMLPPTALLMQQQQLGAANAMTSAPTRLGLQRLHHRGSSEIALNSIWKSSFANSIGSANDHNLMNASSNNIGLSLSNAMLSQSVLTEAAAAEGDDAGAASALEEKLEAPPPVSERQNGFPPTSPTMPQESPTRPPQTPQQRSINMPEQTRPGRPRKPVFPKLMLLTVAEKPKHPYELQVGVEDLSPVESWICPTDGPALDGVYLQYQPEMMEPDGAAALRRLSVERGFDVGIWTYSKRGPDDYETFHHLVQECNVTYVNTDLPTNFRKDIKVLRKCGTL